MPKEHNRRVEARPRDLLSRQGNYGFDAPAVPLYLGGGGVVLLGFAILSATVWDGGTWALFPLLGGLFMLLSTASYIYTTRAGKFAVWAEILRNLGLRGDEHVLDMGCGRGAVLLMAAKLLPQGRAVGLDLWRTVDQSGNSMEMTLENAELEGVRDRVELKTGDITQMPFPDGSFDVVLSALAIHNIKDRRARLKAIDEAVRVLTPGGHLAIADIGHTTEYADRLRQLGMSDVQGRGLGWRYWYGGPWVATTLVTAKKP
ncbi:MAG: class I SAM-dependent methyltransferase [Candidatus Dormibacteraeota bacterium]|nr:class I SAM-dependent methyltransferase [Candidatus Dormibacteraeota bacterium]